MQVLTDVFAVHQHDPRYSPEILARIHQFLTDPDVQANPERHGQLVYDMRVLALLTSTSSAYPEVRAVSSDTDDPELPTLTVRVWVIGTVLSAIGCVINAIFALRYPTISISSNVVQLVACESSVVLSVRTVDNWRRYAGVMGILCGLTRCMSSSTDTRPNRQGVGEMDAALEDIRCPAQPRPI
jgi:hypothetical protein